MELEYFEVYLLYKIMGSLTFHIISTLEILESHGTIIVWISFGERKQGHLFSLFIFSLWNDSLSSVIIQEELCDDGCPSSCRAPA